MENLEQLFKQRINAKEEKRQAEIDKYIKIRDEKIDLCRKFLAQIEFLNKYGFKWEILSYCNNGNDCCRPYYAWNVCLHNRTMATSPFESKLYVKEIDGEIKATFMHTILGHGRYVEGQDKNGYFTAKQFILAFS